MVKLQLALDMLTVSNALKTAKMAEDFDILEVGTPLIKSEGMAAVCEIRKLFQSKEIVADLKIVEMGYLEAGMAAKAGANGITVLGTAPDEVIKTCIKAKEEFGLKIMADFINVPGSVERALQLEKLGVDCIIVHSGLPQQNGKKPFEEFKLIKDAIEAKVAIAGGINLQTITEAIDLDPDIIVIGAAVTKAQDIEGAVKDFIAKAKKAK